MFRRRVIAIGLLGVSLWQASLSLYAAEASSDPQAADWHIMVAADRMEYQARAGADAALWDIQSWIGGDVHKAQLKTEGEWSDGPGIENAELQALYSRAISSYWDLQLGVRHDPRPRPTSSYASVGVMGLAPYQLEVDLVGFVSEDGDLSARAEVEYGLRITRRWVLQPRVEINVAFSDVPESGIDQGVTEIAAGWRFGYEIRPDFAPYVGLSYTKDYRNELGHDPADQSGGRWRAVIGLRAWF